MSDKVRLNKNKLLELIMPSSSSSILDVVAGLVIIIGVIFVNRFRPGRLGLNNLTTKLHQTLSGNYLNGSLTTSIWVNRLPLIFFGLVVLILVLLTLFDFNKFSKPKLKARKILQNISLRIPVAIIWFAFLYLLFNKVLPDVAKISIVATTASNIWAMSGYLILAILIAFIAIHLSVILLRLLFLKTRIIKF